MTYIQARQLRREPDIAPVLFAIVTVAALVLAMMLVVAGGALVLFGLGGITLIVFVTAKPRLGVYVVLAFAMLSETHLNDPNHAAGTQLFTTLSAYGLLLTPAELVMAFAALGVAIHLVFDSEVDFRPGALILPLALFMLAAVFGVCIGLTRGADLQVMRQETRSLFYLPVLYLVITHFVRTRSQVETLMWVFIAIANVVAIENIYRYMTSIRAGYSLTISPNLAFDHESALFLAAAIVLLMARIAFSARLAGEWKSAALMALPIVALLVMKRRAGVVALDVGLAVLCLVLLRENVRAFLMVVPIAALFFGLLLALTWNAPGGSGTFARSFRSATGDQTVSERDASSDQYRVLEAQNIRLNIQSNPVVGIGFGREYAFYVKVADLSQWELWRFVPHNSVLWFWMKVGVFGFVTMTTLFAVAIARSMQIMRSLHKDSMKPCAFAMGTFVIMFVVYSWVDLGLVTPRTMVFFGIVLGMIGALGYVATPETPEPASSSPEPSGAIS